MVTLSIVQVNPVPAPPVFICIVNWPVPAAVVVHAISGVPGIGSPSFHTFTS